MRKRQLKRLEAKHAKDGELLSKCKQIKSKINFLKKAIKAMNNNPDKVVLSVVVGIGEEFFGVSDCFDFSNRTLIDIIDDRIGELQQEFKRL